MQEDRREKGRKRGSGEICIAQKNNKIKHMKIKIFIVLILHMQYGHSVPTENGNKSSY